MTTIVFDIETDGLWPNYTKVHVISLKPLDGPIESYSDTPLPLILGSIQNGLDRLTDASMIIGHAILGFDLPCLKDLHDWVPSKTTKITDTYVLSRLLNPDRPKPTSVACKGGPHSLEAWGCRVGQSKPSHEDWSVFDSAMLRRNRSDVEINTSVYHLLEQEIIGHDWSEAIEIEHEVQRIITEQERTGVKFDVTRAEQYVNDLEARILAVDDELIPRLPRNYKPWGAIVSQPFKTNGHLKKMVTDWYTDLSESNQYIDSSSDNLGMSFSVGGPFTRLQVIEFNLNSQQQVKDYLFSHGWVPTKWNYNDDGERTSPVVTPDSLEGINSDFGKLIKERVLYSHRKNQIQGWLERVRDDGRLSAGANTCGTNTGRFRHVTVVNVPKAVDEVFFGKEMRSLFTASEGRVLVGHDADGLELRMLSHYMDDPEFTNAILMGDKSNGTDVHSVNQRAAGLPTRDSAKTFIYALIYGAGDEKLGTIVGGNSSTGREIRKRFLDNMPKLKRLIENVKRASKKGYLKGLDGRKVWMRKDPIQGKIMEHKALNTLLQSAGAIVMKKSMIILDQSIQFQSIGCMKVLDMHDEAQADVLPEYVEQYKELAVNSVVKSGEHFKLRIPLAASASEGVNWASTH